MFLLHVSVAREEEEEVENACVVEDKKYHRHLKVNNLIFTAGGL